MKNQWQVYDGTMSAVEELLVGEARQLRDMLRMSEGYVDEDKDTIFNDNDRQA